MPKIDYPVTPAIRVLRENKIDFIPHIFEYEEKGGTHHTAQVLEVEEHQVIKTLVFSDENNQGLIVLMHGDFETSTKELARVLGKKKIEPADQKTAEKWTGYQFGGTSPFGTKNKLQVYIESSILNLDKIYINGGKRGFIIEISPLILMNIFNLIEVNVAIKK